jgi:hypothetical protein
MMSVWPAHLKLSKYGKKGLPLWTRKSGGKMFDFLSFKKQVGSVRARVDELSNAIDEKRGEIKRLQTASPQKADVVAYFDEVIDRLAAGYDAALQFSVERLSDDPLNFNNANGIGILTAAQALHQPSLHTMEAAIISLFRDDVKASLRKRVEAMVWPAESGPPITERPAMIEKAKRDLDALLKDQADLRQQAASAGITI